MLKSSTPLLLSALAVFAFSVSPALANEEAAFDCAAHAQTIDQSIGAEKAVEAFNILHGDTTDDAHVIDGLKAAHPEAEAELEAFAKGGCTAADLEAHAHDAAATDAVAPEAATEAPAETHEGEAVTH